MRLETRLVRADRSEVPVQVTASWVDESAEGQAAHLVMIVEDITDRKALEAQLVHRSLHDALPGCRTGCCSRTACGTRWSGGAASARPPAC